MLAFSFLPRWWENVLTVPPGTLAPGRHDTCSGSQAYAPETRGQGAREPQPRSETFGRGRTSDEPEYVRSAEVVERTTSRSADNVC